MGDVPLEVPLASFSLGWGGQRDHTRVPRVEQGGHPLDDPALARRVAALEQRDHAKAAVPDPLLELDQLDLQAAELLLVLLLG